MTEILVHYETAEGAAGSVPVLLGETYETAEDFVREFLADHPDYTIVKIREVPFCITM